MKADQPVRSLMQRPVALLMVLAMGAGGAWVGWNQVDDTFQSTASVVVVPAAGGSSTTGGSDNPLAKLDDNIARLALVVSAQLDADAVREKVVAAGGDGDYVVDSRSSQDDAASPLSAVITLTATSSTATGAQTATEVLMTQASDQLAAVQSAANVSAGARARIVEVAPASAGVAVGQMPWQSAAVLGAAAALAALFLVVVGGWRSTGRRHVDAVASTAPPTWVAPTPDRAAAPAAPAPDSAPVSHLVSVDEGRFAAPSEGAGVTHVAQGARRRQELLRDMVREDWQRSGSNVPWTRREQREAYDRAEQRLVAQQRRLHDLEIENVRGHEDFLGYRDHG